jgi:hypothetical protein
VFGLNPVPTYTSFLEDPTQCLHTIYAQVFHVFSCTVINVVYISLLLDSPQCCEQEYLHNLKHLLCIVFLFVKMESLILRHTVLSLMCIQWWNAKECYKCLLDRKRQFSSPTAVRFIFEVPAFRHRHIQSASTDRQNRIGSLREHNDRLCMTQSKSSVPGCF